LKAEKTLPQVCATCYHHTTIRPTGKKPVIVCAIDDRPKKATHTCILHKPAVDLDLLGGENDVG